MGGVSGGGKPAKAWKSPTEAAQHGKVPAFPCLRGPCFNHTWILVALVTSLWSDLENTGFLGIRVC